MSTLTAERLYALLPSVYRLRDAEQPGEPLRALIAAIAEQFAVLEENVEQLYDDQFIETCASWVVPYIGDLIGYRPLHGLPADLFSARAEVANMMAYRRRKGTVQMLEQLANDVTGWPAHVVEYFEFLGTTQYMNHIRLHAQKSANLRDLPGCLREGGAFAPFAHFAEMRSPENGGGRYNIPNIGIHLWRLMPIRLAWLPLVADPGDASGRKFRFNPLNADMRLFRRPRAEDDISHLSDPINVPEPLSVRLMALAVKAAQASTNPVPDDVVEDDYGAGESIQLRRQAGPNLPVPVAAIRICDLRDILDSSNNVIGWNHEASVAPGTIGVDPERGRVLLGSIADGPLEAAFHYGTPSPIGGGDYERTPPGLDLLPQRTAANSAALQPELNLVKAGGRLLIMDSRTYAGTPTFKVDGVTLPGQPGLEVVVAARNSVRPLIKAAGTMNLDIRERARLVFDGLVISGGMLHLAAAADGETRELVLRHCTLVPGRTLKPDGNANSPGAVSLRVDHPFAKVTLIDCVTGPLVIAPDVDVEIKNCVIDAGAPERVAYAGAPAGGPGGTLIVRESTIIGKLHARSIKLASNSIFFASRRPPPASDSWAAPVIVERRQQGCLRFCFVPTGSITPRRYRCVPDGEHPDAIPQFTSLRYGDPAYCQLRGVTDRSIRMGADDESEMGVLHDLYQPQREANLRIRLEEYLRFGLRAGIFYAT